MNNLTISTKELNELLKELENVKIDFEKCNSVNYGCGSCSSNCTGGGGFGK